MQCADESSARVVSTHPRNNKHKIFAGDTYLRRSIAFVTVPRRSKKKPARTAASSDIDDTQLARAVSYPVRYIQSRPATVPGDYCPAGNCGSIFITPR